MATLETMLFCHGSADSHHPGQINATEVKRLVACNPGDTFRDLILYLRIRADKGLHYFDLKAGLNGGTEEELATFMHAWPKEAPDVFLVKIGALKVQSTGTLTCHLYDETGVELGHTDLRIE